MIRKRVLGLQASHLLLIPTNLDYGAVLRAACAGEGYNASGLVWFLVLFYLSYFQSRLFHLFSWETIKSISQRSYQIFHLFSKDAPVV
jgi:hypothetical protein